jgi:hypothetical protein
MMTILSLSLLPISVIPTMILGATTCFVLMMIALNVLTDMSLDLLDGILYEIKRESSDSIYF